MDEHQMHFESRMSDADALMWNIEKDPHLRSTITVVLVFDHSIERARLVDRFERLSRVIPRLRQRVRSNMLSLAPPRWENDPNFDLSFHLWWVRAPGRRRFEDILSLAEPLAMSGFDRARPQWRATVVEGMTGGRSAIIFKLHHSITDGVGGVKLQMELLDLERDAPERVVPPPSTEHVMSQPERFLDAFGHIGRTQLELLRRSTTALPGLIAESISDPAGTASSTAEMVSSINRVLRPAAAPLSPLMTGRSLSYRFDTITLALDEMRAAAHAVGGTLNDAFVGGILRGLHRYHEAHGVECSTLRMAIPISVRTSDKADLAGNAFVPARIEIPIDQADPVDTLHTVHELVGGARSEPANQLVDPLANLINRLPTTAVTALFGAMVKTVDFTTSNVPGPPVPMYLAGAKLDSQFPFGPLAGAALNITLLSYCNDLNIGISADPAAVPDAKLLHRCLLQGFGEVLALS